MGASGCRSRSKKDNARHFLPSSNTNSQGHGLNQHSSRFLARRHRTQTPSTGACELIPRRLRSAVRRPKHRYTETPKYPKYQNTKPTQSHPRRTVPSMFRNTVPKHLNTVSKHRNTISGQDHPHGTGPSRLRNTETLFRNTTIKQVSKRRNTVSQFLLPDPAET